MPLLVINSPLNWSVVSPTLLDFYVVRAQFIRLISSSGCMYTHFWNLSRSLPRFSAVDWMAVLFIRCCTPLTHSVSFTYLVFFFAMELFTCHICPLRSGSYRRLSVFGSMSRVLRPSCYDIPWMFFLSIIGSGNCFRRLLMKLLASVIGLFSSCFRFFQATLLCVRYFSPLFALARPYSGGVRHVFTPSPCCWSVLFRHPFMWGSSRWVPSVVYYIRVDIARY